MNYLTPADWAELERQAQSDEEQYPYEEIRARLELLGAEIDRRRAGGEPEFTPEEAVGFVARLRRQGK